MNPASLRLNPSRALPGGLLGGLGGDVSLRPTTPADEAFLFALFVSTRAHTFALLPLPEAQKESLKRMQYAAQRQSYRQQFPLATHSVVLVDAEPVGGMIVERGVTAWRLIDIALLPACCGRGLGQALLTDLLDEADASQRDVVLSVASDNPARRLYERLGFRVDAQCPSDDVYVAMRRDSGAASSALQ